MDPVWLPFTFFWLALAVVWGVLFRRRRRMCLAACATSLLAAGAFFFLAIQRRPQLDLVNDGTAPVLVTVEGEFQLRKLVPTQELSVRYDLGADLTIQRVTDAGPGESRTFPLPDGKDREVFKASVKAAPAGPIEVEFGDGAPK